MKTMWIRTGALSLALAALSLTVTRCTDGEDPAQPPPPPPPPDRTLTVQITGNGKGTVTSQPAGIDCRDDGGTCTARTSRTGPRSRSPARRPSGWPSAGGARRAAGPAPASSPWTRTTVGAAFGNPNLVAKAIGPAGGEILSADGRLTLSFPAGALPATETITVEVIDPAALGLEVGDFEVALAYELGPDALAFLVPVTAELLSDEKADVTGDSIAVGLAGLTTASGGEATPLANQELIVDAESRAVRLRGQLGHFSRLHEEKRIGGKEGALVDFGVFSVPAETEVGVNHDLRFTVGAISSPDRGHVIESADVTDASDNFIPEDRSVTFPLWLPGSPSTFPFAQVVTFSLRRALRCLPASPPPVVPGGLFIPGPVVNPNRMYPLFRLSGLIVIWFGDDPADEPLPSPAGNRALTFSGADAAGQGLFVVYDPFEPAVVLERRPGFYVWGTLGAIADVDGSSARALLAWSPRGLALYTAAPGAAFGEAPAEVRTDLRIGDAAHAGGGVPPTPSSSPASTSASGSCATMRRWVASP